MRKLTVSVVLAGAFLAVPEAGASFRLLPPQSGTPLIAGVGPDVAYDSTGTAHVVAPAQPTGVRYCRVLRTGRRCANTAALAGPGYPVSPPRVFVPAPGQVVVVSAMLAGGRTVIGLWRSADGGRTFTTVPLNQNAGESVSFDDAVLGPGDALSLGGYSTYLRLLLASPNLSTGRESKVLTTNLPAAGTASGRRGAVGVAGGTTPVVVNWFEEADGLAFNRWIGGPYGGFGSEWTTGELVPDARSPDPVFLASGLAGLLLVYDPGEAPAGVQGRLWDGTRFGAAAPVRIFEQTRIIGDLFATPTTPYHAVWVAPLRGNSQLRWAWSRDGRRFSPSSRIAHGPYPNNVAVAAGPDYSGLAVFGGSAVSAARLMPEGGFGGCRPPRCEPVGAPPVERVLGRTISLEVAVGCRPGRARVIDAVTGSGVTRAVMTLDRGAPRTDVRPPFSSRYTTTAGLHTVRARVTVAGRGTSRSVSLQRTFYACV